jgi:hypothetical protein
MFRKWMVYNKGGPSRFFPRAKNIFPLDPGAKEPLLATYFKNNSHFLSLKIDFQKWQVTIVYGEM